MKTNRYSRFFAILKQVNANGMTLTKENAVSDYTNKQTTSLSSLSDDQLQGLVNDLSKLTQRTGARPQNIDPTADKLRKGIISQFLSISRTADDAKAWAEKCGVMGNKTTFNNYSNQELYLLFQNAKKVKKAHIKSLTRN